MPAPRNHALGLSVCQGFGCGRGSNMSVELYGAEVGPRAALGGNRTVLRVKLV